jgi:hypothetical protein
VILASGSDAINSKNRILYQNPHVAIEHRAYGNTRDEPAQVLDHSIESISATRVRKLARDNQRDQFVSLMPDGVSDEILREVYHVIRAPQTN